MLPFEKLIHSKSVWILFIFLTSTTFGFLEEFRRHDVERRSVRGSRSSLERFAGEMPFQRDTRRQADEKDRVYENLYDRRSFRTGTDRRIRNEDRFSRFRNRNTDIRSDRLDQNWNDQRRMIDSRDIRTRETDRIIPTRSISNERRSRDVELNRDQRAQSPDNRQERLFREERRSRDTQEKELQRERREDRFSDNRMLNIRENQRRSLNNREERLFRENPSRENRQRGYFMRQFRTRNVRQRDARENYESRRENREQDVRDMSDSTERINRQRRLQERQEEAQIRNQRDQNRERLLERREESFGRSRHERNLVNSERRIESREMEREIRDNSRENRERSTENYVRYNRDNQLSESRQLRVLNRRREERTPFETNNARLSRNRSTALFSNIRDRNSEQRVSRDDRDSNERSMERRNSNSVGRTNNFRTIRDRGLEQRVSRNDKVSNERSMERGNVNRVVRSVRSSLTRDNRNNNHPSMQQLDANMNEVRTNRERKINIRSEDRSDFYRERNVRNQRESLSRENIRDRFMDSSRFARRSDEIRYRNEDAYSRNLNIPTRSVRELSVRTSLSRSDSAGQARQARFNSEVSRQETSTCTSAQRNTERQTSSQSNVRQNEAQMRKLTDRTSENVAVSRSRNSIEKRSVPIVEFMSNSGRTVEELKGVQYNKQNFKFDHLANVIQVILGVYLIGQILAHSSKKKSSGFYKMLPSLSAIKEKLE